MSATFILEHGTPAQLWEQAERVVFPKKSKNLSNVKSYKYFPNQFLQNICISYYKRLNHIISSYIHINQTGFIPRKDITNTRKILDIIQGCKTHNLNNTCILALDVEKVFDGVELAFLKLVVKGFW